MTRRTIISGLITILVALIWQLVSGGWAAYVKWPLTAVVLLIMVPPLLLYQSGVRWRR